jgi:hypothetical protein
MLIKIGYGMIYYALQIDQAGDHDRNILLDEEADEPIPKEGLVELIRGFGEPKTGQRRGNKILLWAID